MICVPIMSLGMQMHLQAHRKKYSKSSVTLSIPTQIAKQSFFPCINK